MTITCKPEEVLSYLSERFLLHYHLGHGCFENDVAKKKKGEKFQEKWLGKFDEWKTIQNGF